MLRPAGQILSRSDLQRIWLCDGSCVVLISSDVTFLTLQETKLEEMVHKLELDLKETRKGAKQLQEEVRRKKETLKKMENELSSSRETVKRRNQEVSSSIERLIIWFLDSLLVFILYCRGARSILRLSIHLSSKFGC